LKSGANLQEESLGLGGKMKRKLNKFAGQLDDKETIDKYILISLTLVSFYLALLFWQNSLYVYDAAGHVSLVRQIASNFWPSLSGWNPRELLGWPQGIFYPSLFHWLAATLSFITGIHIAIKVLVSLALVILPISLLAFGKSLIKNQFWSGVMAILLFFLILIFPNFLGTGIRSLFQIGLLSNFFVLPFVFFFLASVHREGKDLITPTILLSLIILTHIVAALVVIIYLVIFLASKFLIEKKIDIIFYLKIIIFTLLLTVFFWLPFMLNLSYTSVSRHVGSYFLPNVVVFGASFLLIFYGWRKKEANLFILSSFSSLFALVATIDLLLIRGWGTSFVLYPFHIYRFQPYIYLFFGLAVLLFLIKKPLCQRIQKDILIKNIIFALSVGLILTSVLWSNPAELPNTQLKFKNAGIVKGRFLETFRRGEVEPFWYGLQTEILANDKNAVWAYGLFTDSSPNGPYLGSLIKSARPEVYMEKEEALIETKIINQKKTEQLLKLLTNFTISLDNKEKNSIGTLVIENETKYFNIQKVSDSNLFEVVNLPLKPIEGSWNVEVERWWTSKGTVKNLPYLTNGEKLPKLSAKEIENARVKLLNTNKNQTNYKLRIDSYNSVPILVKISYFPYWKAFGKEGKEIPIYRAAPNLIVFAARGEVELVYNEPIINRVALFISLISWVIVFGLFGKKFVRRIS